MRIVLYACALLLARVAVADGPSVERDLAYGSDAKQRLDLSVPAAKGFPTVVFVHGGSLTSGDKADEDYREVCRPFPAAGIACANVNYRLAPGHAWPAQPEDVAAAVTWVRANIGARGGDPAKLFLLGHSSGAMLVALLGTGKPAGVRGVMPMGSIMYDDELEQAIEKHGRERVEVAFGKDPDSAMYGSLASYLDHWPIRHVTGGMAPYLFLIVEEEKEHPPVLKTNKAFVERTVALGNRAELRVLAGRNHYGAIRKLTEPGDPVFALIRDFVLK
jgi:acetyl esterase/lipase